MGWDTRRRGDSSRAGTQSTCRASLSVLLLWDLLPVLLLGDLHRQSLLFGARAWAHADSHRWLRGPCRSFSSSLGLLGLLGGGRWWRGRSLCGGGGLGLVRGLGWACGLVWRGPSCFSFCALGLELGKE